MPTRLIDGEALWSSDRVKSLKNPTHRLAYVLWLPLAEANGVCELNVHAVRAKVYGFLLPDTLAFSVLETVHAFIDAGLLKLWKQDGKLWAYFVGIDDRLPNEKHMERYKHLPPNPPTFDSSSRKYNPGYMKNLATSSFERGQ